MYRRDFLKGTVAAGTGTMLAPRVAAHANPGKNSGRGVLRVGRYGRYFEFEDGTPYMPIGFNTFNNLLYQYYTEAGYFADHEVEGLFQELTQHGGNYLRLFVPPSLERNYFKTGKYLARDVSRLDWILALAARYGVCLYVELFAPHNFSWWYDRQMDHWAKNPYNARNGGPIQCDLPQDIPIEERVRSQQRAGYNPRNRASMQAQKAKVDLFIKRFGSSSHILCWGLSNDFPFDLEPEAREWLVEMTEHVRHADPNNHLVSLQCVSGVTWPKWIIDLVDFLSVRAYPWTKLKLQETSQGPSGDIGQEKLASNAAQTALALNRQIKAHLACGKPIITGEFGGSTAKSADGMYDTRITSDIDLCFLYGLWSSLASGGMPGHKWCGMDGFFSLTAQQYTWLQAVAEFCKRVDWAAFNSTNMDREIRVSMPNVVAMGCRDRDRAILWLMNTDASGSTRPVRPVVTIGPGLAPVNYDVIWIDPMTNNILARANQVALPGELQASASFEKCATALLVRA